jgi:hypothetical protein
MIELNIPFFVERKDLILQTDSRGSNQLHRYYPVFYLVSNPATYLFQGHRLFNILVLKHKNLRDETFGRRMKLRISW